MMLKNKKIGCLAMTIIIKVTKCNLYFCGCKLNKKLKSTDFIYDL